MSKLKFILGKILIIVNIFSLMCLFIAIAAFTLSKRSDFTMYIVVLIFVVFFTISAYGSYLFNRSKKLLVMYRYIVYILATSFFGLCMLSLGVNRNEILSTKNIPADIRIWSICMVLSICVAIFIKSFEVKNRGISS